MAAALKKSKRVSWAPDVNLCQVRLFLSEDAPSQAGLGAQDHLQAKASWLWHATEINSEDQLPPGFEGPQSMTIPSRKDFSGIPLIKWKCPPIILLNPHWQVVAGEESVESEIQNQREMRMLEAVYPRPSAIPPSPSVASDIEECHYDDYNTRLIPLVAIEDDVNDNPVTIEGQNGDDIGANMLGQSILSHSFLGSTSVDSLMGSKIAATTDLGNPITSVSKPPTCDIMPPMISIAPGVEPDVVAAASAAFTAIMRSSEEGSLIDRDLLIKILSNPMMIEQLVKEYGGTSNTQQTGNSQVQPIQFHSSPAVRPLPLITTSTNTPPLPTVTKIESDTPLFGSSTCATTSTPQELFYAGSSTVTTSDTSPIESALPTVKDVNYYKTLIQKHGGEKQEAEDRRNTLVPFSSNNRLGLAKPSSVSPFTSRQRDSRPKIPKPCVYFNSPRGCRNGDKCSFLHDASSLHQQPGTMAESPSVKRVKLEREITGRS